MNLNTISMDGKVEEENFPNLCNLIGIIGIMLKPVALRKDSYDAEDRFGQKKGG